MYIRVCTIIYDYKRVFTSYGRMWAISAKDAVGPRKNIPSFSEKYSKSGVAVIAAVEC